MGSAKLGQPPYLGAKIDYKASSMELLSRMPDSQGQLIPKRKRREGGGSDSTYPVFLPKLTKLNQRSQECNGNDTSLARKEKTWVGSTLLPPPPK